MKKLAIFDFCDTLVNGQTANKFIYFILKKSKPNLISRLIIFAIKLRLVPNIFTLKKKLLVFTLRGISKSKLKKFSKEYSKMLETRLNEPLIKKLIKHSKEGYSIVIISGGYESYLKYFIIPKINFTNIIGTKLEVNNKKLSGFIKGKDCMGLEKIKRLNSNLNLKKYNLVKSYVYSDSMSDMPLFMLVGNPIYYNSKERIMEKLRI